MSEPSVSRSRSLDDVSAGGGPAARAHDPYARALDAARDAGVSPRDLERLLELHLLARLAEAVGSGLGRDAALTAALEILAGALGTPRGAVFASGGDGALVLQAAHGLGPDRAHAPTAAPEDVAPLAAGDALHDRLGLAVLAPVRHDGRAIGAVALGPREGGYETRERDLLRRAAALLAAPIAAARLGEEARRLQRDLAAKDFQLRDLFDVSRELTGGHAEEALHDLLLTAAMGHFVVARAALYLPGPDGLSLARARGLREGEALPLAPEDARAALAALAEPAAVAELPDGPLRARLRQARLVLAIPLASDDRVEGLLAVGARASGAAFSAEDRAFARTLGSQALAALENARLQRLREEKRRQDRELQVARDIQRSLFPTRPPQIPGFEVAGESRPCFEVGGDSYDWIPLDGGRLALVVADVAGKGTPASLLMASVHASVQALSATAASPAVVVERLDRFLFANTQPSRYVTLFYAELQPSSRRLVYVNAGHVPPFLLSRDGRLARLDVGGPAPGLLDEAAYEEGIVSLAPGDLVAMVTDGVTEAASPDDREFGDEGVCETLRALSGEGASGVLAGLVGAVEGWAGPAGLGDDLTALILRAR